MRAHRRPNTTPAAPRRAALFSPLRGRAQFVRVEGGTLTVEA